MGSADPGNPFYNYNYPAFEKAAGGQPFLKGFKPVAGKGHVFKSLDARLSVEGFPQSGTGQATLFSGRNAAELIGRHFGPYPHSKTRYLLEEESLFNHLQQRGFSCYFMNAYPKIFFDREELKKRWTCTTLMTLGAGIPLNTIEDVLNEDAITAEILQDVWKSVLELEVPDISAKQAAWRVLRKAEEHDLVLAEYFLTDKAGHGKNPENADRVLRRFDDFLETLLSSKREDDAILLVSDHGNVEDLSTKTHTLNDVPLMVFGPEALVFNEAESLKDIKPACLRWFEKMRVQSAVNISNGA